METHERRKPIKMKEIVPEGAKKIASLLTERDLEMLQSYEKGLTYEEIASGYTSRKTGKTLTRRAVEDRFGKLVALTNAHSKENLIAMLAEEGSIEAEKVRTNFPPEARRAAKDHFKASGSDVFIVKADGENELKITGRQLDVLRLRAIGLPYEEIAKILEISPRTAETHISMAMRQNRPALGIDVRYGKRRGDDVRLLISKLNVSGLLDPKNEQNFIDHVDMREYVNIRKKLGI